MQADLILMLILSAAALVCLASTLRDIKVKADAQRRFVAILSAEEESRRLRHLRARVMEDGVASAEELKELVDSLDRLMKGLSAEHRRAIAEGLHQQSMRGRARYVAKLMNRAGIGSGPLPVPAE